MFHRINLGVATTPLSLSVSVQRTVSVATLAMGGAWSRGGWCWYPKWALPISRQFLAWNWYVLIKSCFIYYLLDFFFIQNSLIIKVQINVLCHKIKNCLLNKFLETWMNLLQSPTQWGFSWVWMLTHFTRMILVLVQSLLSVPDSRFSQVLAQPYWKHNAFGHSGRIKVHDRRKKWL